MIFIYNSKDREPQLTKSKIVWRAYKIIITFPTRSTEQLLDKYLRETYKISLKQACLKILYAAKIAYDSSNTYIITFPTEELRKLALEIKISHQKEEQNKIKTKGGIKWVWDHLNHQLWCL